MEWRQLLAARTISFIAERGEGACHVDDRTGENLRPYCHKVPRLASFIPFSFFFFLPGGGERRITASLFMTFPGEREGVLRHRLAAHSSGSLLGGVRWPLYFGPSLVALIASRRRR